MPQIKLPTEVVARLAAFLAAGLTGNIQLQVKEGRIMGAKIEEHVQVTGQSSYRPQPGARPANGGAGVPRPAVR